jgi:hypothetical protein
MPLREGANALTSPRKNMKGKEKNIYTTTVESLVICQETVGRINYN